MSYVGILQAAGLAKESIVGTLVTPPTEFLPLIAPDSFSEAIELLESKGIRQAPYAVAKVVQGPATLKSGKVKVEMEPENCGNLIMGAFGTDTLAEVASFVVSSGVNDNIDFKEDSGSQVHATLTAGTYIAGTTSGTAGTLCALIKTQMQAVGTGTYTVTYSDTTKKFTIAASGAVTNVQILWATGTNTGTSAKTLLGFTNVDTSSATSVTSNSTTQVPLFGHTFTRLAAAQLPTYSWWFQKGAKYFQFAGCMNNKTQISIKTKDMVVLDTDWTALTYDDSGSSQSATYSALKPFVFNQAVVSLDGSQVNDFADITVTLDNMVEADHALAATIYPSKIVSKGMKTTVNMTLYLENTTQWNKFLAGTSVHLNIVITSGETLTGSASAYSFAIDIPVMNYATAVLNIENGILKVNLTGVAVELTSATAVSAILKNSKATAY
jgi:hypothetical protein